MPPYQESPLGVFPIEAYVNEFIGTFFFVATIGLNVVQGAALAPVSIGFMLMVMIFAGGKVSGGHYNPAVTLGLKITGQFDKSNAVAWFYVLSQCLGALFGGALAFAVADGSGMAIPAPPLSVGHGYGIVDAMLAEIIFTAGLVTVVVGVVYAGQEGQPGSQFGALAIGFLVMAAAFGIGPMSGCSLNPAVTVGLMVPAWAHSGGSMWLFPLYLLCPCVGAVIAANVFSLMKSPPRVKAVDGYGERQPVMFPESRLP